MSVKSMRAEKLEGCTRGCMLTAQDEGSKQQQQHDG